MALGGIFGGGGSVQAPDYSQAINTIQKAGDTAAAMGVFKPVTVSTSFGTPTYTYDSQGRLTSAGYQAAPWLQNLQNAGQGYAGQYQNIQGQFLNATQPLTAAEQAYGAGGSVYDLARGVAGQQAGLYGVGQELYGMGRGLMPTAAGFGATGQALQGTGADLYARAASALPTSYDTTAKTQEYYDRMQQMVAPQREQQLAQTRQNLFNKGRQGLSVGATQAGGMAATNPEMAAYYNAIAQQDLGLANQAEQQALANMAQQTAMGTQLYGAGLGQYQAGLGYGQAGVGATQAAGGLLGQGIGATQAGIGAGTSAANLYTSGTGLFGAGADLQNAYLRNLTASQVPVSGQLSQLGTMEAMAQSPIDLGIRLGTPTTQGMQYGGSQLMNAANQASDLYARQADAAARAANANQGGGFWDALGGMAVTAGLGALTGGVGSGLAGSLGLGGLGGAGLFSSLGTGIGGAIGSGFSSSSMNPFSSAGSAMRGAGFGWTPTGYTMPAGGGW